MNVNKDNNYNLDIAYACKRMRHMSCSLSTKIYWEKQFLSKLLIQAYVS